MDTIPMDKLNINRFWEKTPTVLKYVLVFAIFIVVFYFLVSKRLEMNYTGEIDQMKIGINATYDLIDNFDNFKKDQDIYNKEVIKYLHNMHALINDLNNTTNRKLDMILTSGAKSSKQDVLIEKILLLNESFDKISMVYQTNIERPNLEGIKIKKIYTNTNILPAEYKNYETDTCKSANFKKK